MISIHKNVAEIFRMEYALWHFCELFLFGNILFKKYGRLKVERSED